MGTHYPFFKACVDDNGASLSKRWGKLAYNLIRNAGKGGGYGQFDELKGLIDSIDKLGVRLPITGWALDDMSAIEMFGGHHRAAIAAALGHVEIEIELLPLDIYHRIVSGEVQHISVAQMQKVTAAYRSVSKTESLKPGQSYNPSPGFDPIRPTSQGRLETIYRDIISCRGDRLLDLGCNDGFFGTALAMHDFHVTFVDRSKAYLSVVHAKMQAIEKTADIQHFDIDLFFKKLSVGKFFDVTLYLDVFYHAVLEKGVDAAMNQLNNIIHRTRERLIISPGRWDKLEAAGCTESMVYNMLKKNARQIRYLGTDNDPGYNRDIYSVTY
jgi:SAM-dependent methyltransferase